MSSKFLPILDKTRGLMKTFRVAQNFKRSEIYETLDIVNNRKLITEPLIISKKSSENFENLLNVFRKFLKVFEKSYSVGVRAGNIH